MRARAGAEIDDMTVSMVDDGLSVSVKSSGGVAESFDIGLMAKALAGLFAAGATLALLTVALPHSPRASVLGLLIIVGDAYLVAALLIWRTHLLPKRILPVTLAWGSTLITGVAYFSANNPSPLIFFYLWVILYSSYFFSTRETAVQIAYLGLAYGALLFARKPPSGIPEWWLVGMGTLVVAAILVRSMRARGEMLISRLYDAARTDPLTKLSNRHGFREQLDLEIERARRGETQMTLVVGDLDNFKEVNDRSGRHVGDAALQRLARLFETDKRQIDGLARVGGEEFALILPDTDGHEAFLIAERLRCELAEEFAADAVPITISFGVASYPEHGETAGSLLRASDEALYTAKLSGRNRTVLHSPAMRDVLQRDGEARDIAGERFVAVVLDLAEAVDLRFSGSARHSETVGRYAGMMALELGLSEERVGRVRLAGMLHDIGKVAVPDSILNKPGKLTEEEFVIIKRHPGLGGQILEHPSFVDVRAWVGAHHERPDGRGYPEGLADHELSIESKILAVADAYEAMTSDRSYRSSIGHAAAAAELERCAGTQFDPRVVKALLAVLAREGERVDAMLANA